MVGYLEPYSYDYFPLDDGMSYENFAKMLLDDYLQIYRYRIVGW